MMPCHACTRCNFQILLYTPNMACNEPPKEESQKVEYYRASTSANTIKLNVDEHTHCELDPMGDLSSLLMETDLVANSPVNVSFVVIEIVRYIGYIESNLGEPYLGHHFGCSKRDIEHCFFISFLSGSIYPSYWLKTFRCQIKPYSLSSTYCATLVLWDEEKVKSGEEEIVWQSEQRALKLGNHSADAGDMVDFEINVKVDSSKVYLIKIDVPEGSICCGSVKEEWTNNGQGTMVHATAHFYENNYTIRKNRYSKRYELAITI